MADGDLIVGSQIRLSRLLHLQRDGYLANDNYLAEGSPSVGYLEAGVGAFIAILSTSALLLINADVATGSQIEYRITGDQGVATQVQNVITASDVTSTQVQALITADDTTPSEIRLTIVKDVPQATQALAVITKDRPVPAEIRQVIEAYLNTGSQDLLTIVNDVFVGTEDQQFITQQMFVGSEMEAVRQFIMGSEVRYALYNTTQLRFMCDFPSRGLDGLNWNASNTEPGDFEVKNVNNDIVEYYWRSQTGTLSAILTCDAQISQGVFLDTLGFMEHNLSRGATVVMQGSQDPGFATIGVNETLTWTVRNIYYIAPTLPLIGYRYWRFVIDDPGNPDGFLRVGTIVFGDSQIFSNECNTDTISLSRKQYVDQVFTEGHTNVQNDRGTKRRLGLEFRDLNAGGRNFALLENMFETYGVTHKCLWIPVPRDPARFAVFGKLEELPQQTHNYKGETDDYVDLSITVDESL